MNGYIPWFLSHHQAVKWTSRYFYLPDLPTVHLIPNLNSLISVCMVRISWAITFIYEVEDQAKVLRFLHWAGQIVEQITRKATKTYTFFLQPACRISFKPSPPQIRKSWFVWDHPNEAETPIKPMTKTKKSLSIKDGHIADFNPKNIKNSWKKTSQNHDKKIPWHSN